MLIIAAIVAFAANLTAQVRSGSFAGLKDQSRVYFEVDFSQALIHGMSEADFADYETDWYKDKRHIVSLITNNCNDIVHRFFLVGNYPEAKYFLKLVVRSVSEKGDFVCDLYLYDEEDKQVGLVEGIWGKGGIFGTKLNLIKDGAKSTGEEVGRALYFALRNGKVYQTI